jgi:hypothetical protein
MQALPNDYGKPSRQSSPLLAAQQSSTLDYAGSAQRYAGLAVSRIVDPQLLLLIFKVL